jgi:hypothetical protein
MKTLKQLLIELQACGEAREWAGNKSIEEAVRTCERDAWFVWLAKKIYIDDRAINLTQAHCANTFRHYITDQKAIGVIDKVIMPGNVEVTAEELDIIIEAYSDAYDSFLFESYCDERKMKRRQCAAICREHIGQFIIDKVNQLLK